MHEVQSSIESLAGRLHEWEQRVNSARLLETTRRLWEAEQGQTFAHYHASARLAERLLREAGAGQVERLAFPADGRTVFQDKRLPLGWRATVGRLEVVQAAIPFEPAVVANFEVHPFHLIKGSVATPPEGVEVRLLSQEALYAGADARGALILLNPEERPSFRHLEGTGALGLVTDFLIGRYDTPWAHSWVNGCSDSPSWHIGAEDRPSLGFSVCPQTGERLREALRQGEVRVRATCDGERYEDTVEVVTGVIPGEDPREIWLLAHLYEPLANDNAAGVACALELVRHLSELAVERGRPRFTLRVVFTMEVYGFAAYAEHRGGRLRDKVLCAANLDALPILPGDGPLSLGLSQSGAPSAADSVLVELLSSGLARHHTVAEVQTEGLYADDRLMGDSTIGVPTLWFTRVKQELPKGPARRAERPLYLWHNSEQTMEIICPEFFHEVAALYGAWVSTLLYGEAEAWLEPALEAACARLRTTREQVLEGNGHPGWLHYRQELETRRLEDHLRYGVPTEAVAASLAALAECAEALALPPALPTPEDPVWAVAEKITPRRLRRGLPRDMAAAPVGERNVILPHFAALVLVHADGRRTVAELCDRAGWELGQPLSPAAVREVLGALHYLARHGYVALASPRAVTQQMAVAALREAGVREGDLLFIHSALSPFGLVEGGAETLIAALREAVGERGTLLMPTFTNSILCFAQGPARNPRLVPFHPERARVRTGALAEAFRRQPGVVRSAHPSHSVAGCGPLVAACLEPHGPTDAPAGPSSPLARLPELGGKIVFLGAPLGSCTFLHHLEHMAGVDYLEPALCVVEDDVGERTLVTIPQNLPGDRDFYRPDLENARIFRHLAKAGVCFTEAPLGFSQVQVVEAAPLYAAGLEALREDPGLLLPGGTFASPKSL